jgi:dihydrofolate reductase
MISKIKINERMIYMLSIIVAKAKNNIIGKDNKLLWYLPEDLKRFKDLTTGHVIIMGRKTFESLGRVLPNRKHVVFTQNPDYHIDDENVQVVHSMLEIKEYIDSEEENFVIGGAMIYNWLMPYVSKMYVTEINKDFEGDSFFPKIDPEVWNETERITCEPDAESKLEYDFVTYERK